MEVGLAARLDHRADRLSAGERQRVAIARALAADPVLLLADEPTARLDQSNARAVGELLAKLAHEHGTAVVCATHDPVVIEHADEVLELAAHAPAQPKAAGQTEV
jgi:putative ABC transport system ATP-binding protein